MSRTIAFSAFNLLLSFFPLTTLLAANSQLLREPTGELFVIAACCLGIFVLVETVYLVTLRERVVVLFFFGMFLLFLWKPLLALTGSQGVRGLAVYWGTVLAAFLLVWRGTRSPDLRSIIAFALGAYAAFPAVQVALDLQRAVPERAERLSERKSALEMVEALPEPKIRPDIYFLLFDCTTSTDMVTERIFEGSEEVERRVGAFIRRMRKMGFEHLADSWSNYERTDPSLFSFFNLVYHGDDDGFQWYQKYYGFRQSALRLYLKKHGYRIVSAQKDIPCPEEFDECYPVRGQLQLVSLLASSTPILDVIFKLDKYVFSPLDSNALKSLTASLKTTKLAEIDEFIDFVGNGSSGEQPTFVYAHFYAAHPINFYDANCETESIALFEQRSGDDRSEDFSLTRYGAEYLCFLDRIADVSEAIHRRDPDAWILVFSDHGYGAQRWSATWQGPLESAKLDETFRVLNLVKTSPGCAKELASARTNVNKSRALVNCLAGADALPDLPEQVDLRYMGVDVRIPIGPDGYGIDGAEAR